MNYEEAITYIHNTLKFGSKLGLHNISFLLDLMGNPHKKLKFVHVAGTNGKGSTVTFISSILKSAGYRVGTFISPFIQRFTERIQINNIEINEKDLARITEFVKEKVEIMLSREMNHPTEFEIVTAIAMQYYFEQACDIVVLEVGLGGRYDSTNVIDFPEVAVITTISLDHTQILGDTLPKIAYEKAGIIKNNCEVVLYPQSEEVENVFKDVCKAKEANLHLVDMDKILPIEFSEEGQSFSYKEFDSLHIKLIGEHQQRNALMAVNACQVLKKRGYNINKKDISDGLSKATWPGRLEIVNKNPLVMIDAAHNIEGAEVLVNALNKYFPNKNKIFIFGVSKDKDYLNLIKLVAPLAFGFVAYAAKTERALPVDELALELNKYCRNVKRSDTIKEALQKAMEWCNDDSIICAFGSLYYIGEIREHFHI